MRITDLNIPKDGLLKVNKGHDFGIHQPIKMPRLGKFVVLAGANGAGKSRFLKGLSMAGNVLSEEQNPGDIQTYIEQYRREIDAARKHIASNDEQIKKDYQASYHIQENLKSTAHIERRIGEIKTFEESLEFWEWFKTDPKYKAFSPVFFVPTVAVLESAENSTSEQIKSHAALCKNLGASELGKIVPSYLKFVLRRARNAEHALLNGDKGDEVNNSIGEGKDLKIIVEDLLGKKSDLKIDFDDQVKLFGRADFTSSLSNGQKILLMLAATLHAQKTSLSDALLFLDEPENHLHPIVLNQIIDVLIDRVKSGQIWIATHSIPLIARLNTIEPASTWYVVDSTISHAGRRPEIVLHGLLGDDDQISQLRDFTDLPAILAANRFAAECIFPPTTVSPREGDAQQSQMANVLKGIIQPEKPLRVLDFGAGQGRLLAALYEVSDSSGEAITNFDYIAYDRKGMDNERCRKQIEIVYSSPSNRFYTELADIGSNYPGGVDVVVMCNVLHEIPPSEWLSTIGPHSQLAGMLRDDGYLLIVEDQRIPIGELAHDYGFLVFDTPQFNKLFDITEDDLSSGSYLVNDARAQSETQKGRLKAHLFKKSLLMRITDTKRKNAILNLHANAASSIKAIRDISSERSYANGQLHGFWMSQFANAALWIRDNGVGEGNQ